MVAELDVMRFKLNSSQPWKEYASSWQLHYSAAEGPCLQGTGNRCCEGCLACNMAR